MSAERKIKVLVVDDSALVRKVLGSVFARAEEFEVRFAKSGLEALALNHSFAPDVITLDIQMPEMDGLACLDRIMVERPCPVVMVSSLTDASTAASIEALKAGAVDVMPKPAGAVSLHMEAFGPILLAKVRAASVAKLRSSLRLKERVRARKSGAAALPRKAGNARPAAPVLGDGLVLIGVSTGGPPALETVLSALPKSFAWPIVIAQHMPASFTGALARRLNSVCGIKVVELDAVQRLEAGVAYIGKGDADMIVEARAGKFVGKSVTAQAGYLWRPSVDRLVRSALDAAPAPQLVGVLMTGMGNDGASAMALMKERGGRTIAESEETAVVWGMPGELVRADGADWVLPLGAIAGHLQKLIP